MPKMYLALLARQGRRPQTWPSKKETTTKGDLVVSKQEEVQEQSNQLFWILLFAAAVIAFWIFYPEGW